MIKKTFSILFASAILFLNSNAIAADDFYIKKGNQFELCKEVKQVLDDPENKSYADPYIKNPEFKIPKKYKNFRLPNWQDIPMEDLSKYLKDPNIVFEKMKRNNDNVNKYKLQKTGMDYDHDGKVEVMIRLTADKKTDDSRYSYHYASDAGEETFSSKMLNTSMNSENVKLLFFYKGRVYKGESSWNEVRIHDVKTSYTNDSLYNDFVCHLTLISSKEKIASKNAEHAFDIRSLKKAEENQKSNPTPERAALILQIKERLKTYQVN